MDGSIDVLELDVALGRLERVAPREARVVELRFFAGLSIAEAAVALDISESSVERAWVTARAWLRKELAEGPPNTRT